MIKDINLEDLEKLASYGCTYNEIADYFDVDKSLLIKRKDLQDTIKRGQSKVKVSLRRKQVQLALDDTNPKQAQMLIWLGKVMLDQKEITKIEHEFERGYDNAKTQLEMLISGLLRQEDEQPTQH